LYKQKHSLAAIGILAVIYFLAGKLGLSLAFVHPSATAVWPPAGIALAALLIFGYRVWPGILLGAFFVNLTTAGSAATSVGIAIGNTLEGLTGAYLVNRFAGGRDAFNRAQDTFKFAILAGILSTTIAATFGVSALALGGFARWADYTAICLTWWLGDGVGIVVVAPLLILWISDFTFRWRGARFVEAAALVACLLLVGQIVFGEFFLTGVNNYPLEYLCIPFLIWTAFRFGQREAATATLVLAATAIWGTLHGYGPFVRTTPHASLLLLQAFVGVVAVTTIALAAVVAELQRAEEKARELALSDPLTGLANYRKLIDTLDAEINRFGRTERSFTVLLLDLDGLKRINDRHGHLVGSQALYRLAEVLRIHCRSTDTPARYGGDEFAVILPETEKEAAFRVALRISQRLAEDRESPPLSVSIGVAVYPGDGETIEKLLDAADRTLYESKRRAQESRLLARGAHGRSGL
jgi:diguanylate cyclase (GGDEF)-like protein